MCQLAVNPVLSAIAFLVTEKNIVIKPSPMSGLEVNEVAGQLFKIQCIEKTETVVPDIYKDKKKKRKERKK